MKIVDKIKSIVEKFRYPNCKNWHAPWYYGGKLLYIDDSEFDIIHNCMDVETFYSAYTYVYCFDEHVHSIYTLYNKDQCLGIKKWCDKNIFKKYRMDMIRVEKYAPSTKWVIDEIMGRDLIFFAFQDKKDYINFILRWG